MAGIGRGIDDPRFRRLNPQLGGTSITPDKAFQEAIPTQAEDYDEIMQGYRDIMGGGNDPYAGVISKYESELSNPKNQFKDVSYTEAPEFGKSFEQASEYAKTGGLSESEQGSLRARAISPIRSIYANMSRNMDRNRRLGGGFSPNYNASAARVAREGSEQIGQTTTNANAAIAEMVQKGRLAMTPEMGRLATSKNDLMNQVNLGNQSNRVKAQDNVSGNLSGMRSALDSQAGRKTDALRGMTSLYGTTPALDSTYGDITQKQQTINNQAKNDFATNKLNRQRTGLGMR